VHATELVPVIVQEIVQELLKKFLIILLALGPMAHALLVNLDVLMIVE